MRAHHEPLGVAGVDVRAQVVDARLDRRVDLGLACSGRDGEIRGDTGRYGEIWGDTSRPRARLLGVRGRLRLGAVARARVWVKVRVRARLRARLRARFRARDRCRARSWARARVGVRGFGLGFAGSGWGRASLLY